MTLVINTLKDNQCNKQILSLLDSDDSQIKIIDTKDMKIRHCLGCNYGGCLIKGGSFMLRLFEKDKVDRMTKQYTKIAPKPYILALAILNIDGILAVCYMQGNPFAWIFFAMVIGLIPANVTRFRA